MERTVKKLKWSEEACYEAAKECGNVTEFRETYCGAYQRSKKYGWIEQYTWFKDGRRDMHKKVYVVYAYEDPTNKCVYIGLTNNIKRRTMEHKKKDYKHSFRKYDRVREYFEEHNMEVPNPIVLIDGIDGIEAQEKEGFYVEQYTNNGWTVINISKTGKNSSSLGNVGLKWTYEKCAEVAATCRNRRELEIKYSGAIDSIRNHEWFELLPPKREYCSFTKEECIEYCKNIESVDDLKKINMNVFRRINNKSWISVCFPKKTYTEIECRELAKKYKNMSEIKRCNGTLAYSINKLALTDMEFKKETEYSFEEMKELCKNYSNRTEFLKKNSKAYRYCSKKGWVDELLPLSVKFFTLEESIEEAKKYVSRDKFRSERKSAYYKLKNAGLLDELLPKHKPKPPTPKPKPVSYKEKYLEIALQYSTLNELRDNHKNVYRYLKKHNLLKETGLIEEEKQPSITREDCLNAAFKCTHKREFRETYPKEYHAASAVYHMLKEFTWLKGCKKEYTEKDCYAAAVQCSSKKEFRETYPNEYEFARTHGLLKNFTWF